MGLGVSLLVFDQMQIKTKKGQFPLSQIVQATQTLKKN